MEISTDINAAIKILEAGDILVFPTETVYGLGADGYNKEAILKVFQAKNRPLTHPLIVHIARLDELAYWTCELPDLAQNLIAKFWPGPLTLILPKNPQIDPIISAGLDSIAIRMPAHPLCQKLIQSFGHGIVGPSANLHCKLSPTLAEHISQDLKGLNFILDGGPCEFGIESSIVSFVHASYPTLAREGSISLIEINTALGGDICQKLTNINLQVPGNMKNHYAPNKPLYGLKTEELNIYYQTQKILKLALDLKDKKAAVLSFKDQALANNIHIEMPKQAKAYAHKLYANLHLADSLDVDCIIIELPPNEAEWLAVLDRLEKSTVRNF